MSTAARMIDTWATVGSCAQIGKNCHISGGAGIGGVLEPLQAGPVIIEDDCFIGARAEVVEGVIVEQGSVLSMGVYLGASTKIVDRATGEVFRAACPPIRWSCPARCPASRCPTAARARPLLRRDRQAGRRAAPAPRPRSTSCCATDGHRRSRRADPGADPLPDASRPMPAALDVLQRALEAARLRLPAPALRGRRHLPGRQSLRPLGHGGPHLAFAGHIDVVPPGDARGLAARSVRRRDRGRPALRPRRRRHEERRRRLRRRRRRVSSPRAAGGRLDQPADHRRRGRRGGQRHGQAAGLGGGAGRALRRLPRRRADLPERLGDTVKIGRRGSVTCRLTVRGRQGHTAYPHRADNAAHRLVRGAGRPDRGAARRGHRAFEPSNLQVTSIDVGNPATNVIPARPAPASTSASTTATPATAWTPGCASRSRRWRPSSSSACSATPRPS